MDSLSQFALGAAVSVAAVGRRAPVWKAALWGGVCGTLPDLDALIDHGDPISNMTLHRAQSHSLLYLTALSPLLAWWVARRGATAIGPAGRNPDFKWWWLATFLALFTHPLLDLMTVYGTQLLQPFTDHPYAIGSVFIIDPLFTLPLLIGLLATAVARGALRHRWNGIGLGLAVAYLGWSMVAQAWVTRVAERDLAARGIAVDKLLVTPTAFNTLLWRIVAMEPGGRAYQEGFHSLLDGPGGIRFDRFESRRDIFDQLRGNRGLERIAWFSHGFFKVSHRDGVATIADIRMGQEPGYVFEFAVARGTPNPGWREIPYSTVGSRGDAGALLDWLWPRIAGSKLPPPRSLPR
jgi:inner membrane protein